MKFLNTTKYYVSIAIVIIASFFLSLNSAAQGIEPIDSDGDGRMEISTKQHLLYLSQNPNADYYGTYEQTNNINFVEEDFQAGGDFYNDGKGFLPIGSNTNYFRGDYFGCNYSINGLYINRPVQDYVGFFGYTAYSNLRNIRLFNVDITGRNDVGGLVGEASGSTANRTIIQNCVVSGTVEGNENVGGITGVALYIEIVRTFAYANVTGNEKVGGLIGTNASVSGIANSYARGNVSGDNKVGGFVGVNSGLIEKCYSTGVVSGNNYTGGFSGMNSTNQLYNSFWDMQSSGQPSSPDSRAAGKTTAEMKDISTFTDLDTEGLDEAWDFKGFINDDNQPYDYWDFVEEENNGYPTYFSPGVPPEDTDGNGKLEIATKDHLLYLSQSVYADYHANYEQVSDIIFSSDDFQEGGDFYNDGKRFSPIGSEKFPFQGSYFGQQFVIENLQINRPAYDYIGFFGYVSYAGGADTLKNIAIEVAYIKGKDNVGALAGYNENITLFQNHTSGIVMGEDKAGGLAGYCRGQVKECYSHAGVSANNYVGGLIGDNYRGQIKDCYATGGVAGNDKVGGLIGSSRGKSGWSTHWARVYRSYSTGWVSEANNVGGLIGESIVSQYYNCFWDNQASGQTSSAGGTGKSNAAMKNVATYTDLATAGLDEAWDFKNNPNDDNSGEDIWKMELSEELNDGYPVLSWQVIPLEAPSVSTLSVQAVGSTYAAARGYISDLGNPNPTQHGVCYNRTGNPTLEDDKTEQGPFDSPAVFLAPLEDLLPDRTYYLKAYAINDVDTVFGEEVSFTTDKKEVYFGGSFTVADKEYDATTDAVIAENNLFVNGAADGDDVVFEDVSVEFASADAADDIEVNIVNAELAGDDSEHYEFISWAFDNALSSTGNIIKKELSVTADDVEREQCAPNPSFTFAYAGFVDGEDESFLTTEPVLNCSADVSSLPGEYDITLSGGEDENYDFNYVNGTLTIIEDTTNPVAVSQDLTIALGATGTASITAGEVDNGSTDNCGIDEMLVQPESFNCAHIGENEVTLTVTDAAGNESSQTAIITVEDNLAPTVITKDITVELNADGQASITTADINDGSSDNCSIETIELDITEFDCSNVGENVVALTAVDPSGNTTSQNATVTVVDETAPEVITQDITLELDANGQAAITTDDVDNGSSDNCSIDSYQLDVSNFDCQDIGEHVVTLTVTDASGNIGEETAVVTVQDNMAPTVITQDMTVELDVSGVASVSIEDIDNGSYDNCTIDSRQLDVTNFDCSDVGDNEVTLTITDVNGNEAQQTAIVTVEDNIAPTVFTQDTLMELNPDGEASILPIEVDDGSHDNCAIDSYELDQFVFDGTDIGENIVTLTVTDNHGNISTETAIITIADNAPPTIITQPVTLYLDMNGEATLTPEEVDNGSYDNVEITNMEIDLDYFACDDTGEHTVTLTANDISGNSSSAAETVTVLDTITPSALQVNPEAPLCYGSNEGQIEVIPQDGFGEVAFSIDNGATWQQGDGLFTDLTAGTYNIVVESANGCLVYHDDNPVVFEEPEELVIDELEVTNVTCNGASNGMINIEAAGGTGAHYFSVDGGDTWQEGHLLYGLPAGSYEVKVMDDNGCVTPYSENPVEISEPEALVYEQVLTTDVTCNGSASGTIDISASGGTGTIEYSIGDDIWQTDGFFEELEAGEYELRIRDDRNCLNVYDDNPVVLQEPEALVIDEVATSDVNCYEGNDGNIELSASGGTGAHQYSIDDGESWQGDNIFSNLESADYNVLVKDENECVTVNESNPVTIDQPDELVINQVTAEDLSCFGSDDGEISIDAVGGSGEIQYAINNEWQEAGTFGSLMPGEYEIEVMDENECLTAYAQNPVNIEEPVAIEVDIEASADTAMVDETITLTAVSNYSDSEFYWEPMEEYGTQVEVSEMVVGEYEFTVTATNENGCEATEEKVLVFTINTQISGVDQTIEVIVMPNPSDGKFAVQVKGMPDEYTMQIFNSNGGAIAERKDIPAHQTTSQFDLTTHTAGTYFLRISSGQKQWVRKIIFNK